MNGRRDTLYSQDRDAQHRFMFDEQVAEVFDDMVGRSVPGYAASLDIIAALAPTFLTSAPFLGYDLGTALGGSCRAMLKGLPSDQTRVVAVDNAPAMLERMQRQITSEGEQRVVPMLSDISSVVLAPANLIVLHLTLQFVAPDKRDTVLKRCAQALAEHKGGLLLFEKCASTADIESAHVRFKANQGYSHIEIQNKRQALDQVLIVESQEQHCARLKRCGFKRITCIFTALNFCGWLAQP